MQLMPVCDSVAGQLGLQAMPQLVNDHLIQKYGLQSLVDRSVAMVVVPTAVRVEHLHVVWGQVHVWDCQGGREMAAQECVGTDVRYHDWHPAERRVGASAVHGGSPAW